MPSNFERAFETKFLAPSNVKLLLQGFTETTTVMSGDIKLEHTIYNRLIQVPFTRQMQSVAFNGRNKAR